MPVIQLEAQVPTDKLLSVVEQLSEPELEQFARDVSTIVARRKAPSLSQRESELLLKINQGVPSDVHQRYTELIAKRQDETLTEDEYAELLQLTNQVEEIDAERIRYLAELASLRGVTLIALMESLGITTPPYV
ncbi:MAG: STAS/SEC14 domain-containing protein [Chloroflexi bacterium]|nr:STAS/SEC14 domain-containing protein [Chloroflexota bacterium]